MAGGSTLPLTPIEIARARRWTYFHFLGIDIEKSAVRTMDPDALADTNNPTLNNRACTVCHERLDLFARLIKNLAIVATIWINMAAYSSLPESYKCPECFGGDWSDSEYQEGDTVS